MCKVGLAVGDTEEERKKASFTKTKLQVRPVAGVGCKKRERERKSGREGGGRANLNNREF